MPLESSGALAEQLQSLHVQSSLPNSQASNTERNPSPESTAMSTTTENHQYSEDQTSDDMKFAKNPAVPKAVSRWIKSLRRRAALRRSVVCHDTTTGNLFSPPDHNHPQSPTCRYKLQSSSGSSFNVVTTVRSAATSTSSITTALKSNPGDRTSQVPSAFDDASKACYQSTSEEGFDRIQQDTKSKERSFHRRRILEELINTEEGYLGDVRFLMNVSHCR